VLEVRSHEVPFILEDGQTVASLVFENSSNALVCSTAKASALPTSARDST